MCPLRIGMLEGGYFPSRKEVNVHGYPYVEPMNPDNCIGCASCAIVCPDGCIEVYRKKIDKEDEQ